MSDPEGVIPDEPGLLGSGPELSALLPLITSDPRLPDASQGPEDPTGPEESFGPDVLSDPGVDPVELTEPNREPDEPSGLLLLAPLEPGRPLLA